MYDCLQKYLISSWRHVFNSSFAFVGVQLAGYTAAVKNGTGSYDVLLSQYREIAEGLKALKQARKEGDKSPELSAKISKLMKDRNILLSELAPEISKAKMKRTLLEAKL